MFEKERKQPNPQINVNYNIELDNVLHKKDFKKMKLSAMCTLLANKYFDQNKIKISQS